MEINHEKILNYITIFSAIFLSYIAVSICNSNLPITKYDNSIIAEQKTKNINIEDVVEKHYDQNIQSYQTNTLKEKSVQSIENQFIEYCNEEKDIVYNSNECIVESKLESNTTYTEEELDMLSRVIHGEAGSDCISDEHQQLVGAVVMNRIKDPRFPNTMEEVIMAEGQYDCVKRGTYYEQPSERTIENAKKVLNGEVVVPPDLVFQANFKQGYEVYKIFDTPYSRTYFCLG